MSPTQQEQLRNAVRQHRRGLCAAVGPYGVVCTKNPGHDYAHYDSLDDSSWTDRWEEDFDIEDSGQYPVSEVQVLAALRVDQAPVIGRGQFEACTSAACACSSSDRARSPR